MTEAERRGETYGGGSRSSAETVPIVQAGKGDDPGPGAGKKTISLQTTGHALGLGNPFAAGKRRENDVQRAAGEAEMYRRWVEVGTTTAAEMRAASGDELGTGMQPMRGYAQLTGATAMQAMRQAVADRGGATTLRLCCTAACGLGGPCHGSTVERWMRAALATEEEEAKAAAEGDEGKPRGNASHEATRAGGGGRERRRRTGRVG